MTTQTTTVRGNGGGCCGCLITILAIVGALYLLGILT